MDQAMMDNPVTLVIKAPNQKYDDQTINCFLDWTVEKLKTHLSKVYPSKPLTKDQRLVYSGKLLLDHLQLKDVLRKQDEYHMVHLVCASRTPPNSPKPSTSRENARAASTSSKSGSEHSGSASPVSTSQDMPSTSSNHRNEESLRHRHASHTSTNTMHDYFSYNRQQHVGNPIPGQGAPAVFPAYSVFSPLQMMWWQQMYARQYYMQYQAVASNQGPAATPIIHSDRPPTNPPRAAPNIAPEVNQNVQMNVQGGAVMNEEEINRDWLDWIYTVSRAAILLSIVYFYSSFSRFVMVMGAMILVYMHQAGWFPFRQEEGQPQARDNAADVNQDRVNNNELLEMERRMDEGVQEEGADEVADEAAAAPRPGIVASAWSFITTFFTSLIPEGPPQVN
ncbi:homocysteine-responsive endoplasmic reticulum-resident ubiquitin-like domain member 2 protein isoform X1 [Aquarana catesbeiana]|uniref:homocysteine-responsive endoplasmic reticulum-resident ubiquitin-like domain member 2 protein isoform X1 n=1 Tax=Aquarana catesbeiana TaxID=8400 RepID=UPI003CC95614